MSREPHDFDNEAVALHMGTFEVPCTADEAKTICQSGSGPEQEPTASAASATAQPAGRQQHKQKQVPVGVCSMGAARKGSGCTKQLHLYSLAAPGMRRVPKAAYEYSTMGWALPVRVQPTWVKAQKGYFDAPGGCSSSLYHFRIMP